MVEAGADEFDGREFLAAESFESFGDGGIEGVGHGCCRKGNGQDAIGQDKLQKWAESRYKIG
jgi:hypothetical protein